TAGEWRRKEKDNVFGSGSRAPIAISLLVKNPHATQHGQIFFHDIGDYLSREEKLDKISAFRSIAGIGEASGWQSITPDVHGDWLRQRDDSFNEFMSLGDKKNQGYDVLFDDYSGGIMSSRDAWCYNAQEAEVARNMKRMISFYNEETGRYRNACETLSRERLSSVDDFVNTDPTMISWTANLMKEVTAGRRFEFDATCLIPSLYRPFTKQWLYF